MRRIITVLLLSIVCVTQVHAAKWVKLQNNKHVNMMLDRQSITTSGKYQKAWVKVAYKTLQTNIQYPEKSYNNAKLLWYFNCAEQKSATAQVYQLLNEEQIYSAAIDVKRARFLEPVPETEADIAMHYVCQKKAAKDAAAERKLRAEEAAKNKPPTAEPEKKPAKPVPPPPPVAVEAEKKAESNEKQKDGKEASDKEGEQADKKKSKSEKSKAAKKSKHEKKDKHSKKDKHGKEDKHAKKDKHDKESAVDGEHKTDAHEGDEEKAAKKKVTKKKKRAPSWKYAGKKGPEFWGDLSDDFATCKTGSHQSPIDISKTMVTTLKPLKTFQRFPVAEVTSYGHTVQANFKPGNILVVDGVMYQMKHVSFHVPSENRVKGKSFPLEAQFVHKDPKGKMAVLSVMFDEGHDNKALTKLWKQMPKRKSKPKKVTGKILAGDFLPREKSYYRFSGSLTTPPCQEGVVWVVMKTPMTASKKQIDAYKKVIKNDNNRPIQDLNGRIVVE